MRPLSGLALFAIWLGLISVSCSAAETHGRTCCLPY